MSQPLHEEWKNPGAAFRGKPFWSWNGKLKKEGERASASGGPTAASRVKFPETKQRLVRKHLSKI
jgi:hypothetical protein